MPTLTLSLSEAVLSGVEAEAAASGLRATDCAQRILENYLIEHRRLGEEDERDIKLSRSLVSRAVDAARRLVERDGFQPSITYDTIQLVSQDPEWLRDYETLIRDNPFKTGCPRKQTINQNLGYYIKKALGAESVELAPKKPKNVKVKGSIIQSYTELTR